MTVYFFTITPDDIFIPLSPFSYFTERKYNISHKENIRYRGKRIVRRIRKGFSFKRKYKADITQIKDITDRERINRRSFLSAV
ncbi:MAG: hypothetical protein IJF09_02775 [Ruminiclostridium sp.]|nr:hypothetical protein [Ruminiclostridium sp.]